ncbi:MAG: CPBP family intramembrane metalloprotease [Calditrichaeota bacterium]|nr:CPBP family intramembrane metalloprotease [Calditrichota bacterium]
MFILFIPAILNWGIGWSIWYWQFQKLGDYNQATVALQDYLAVYVPLLLLAMFPFYWKRLRQANPTPLDLFHPSEKGIWQDIFTALLGAGLVVLSALVWWKIIPVDIEWFEMSRVHVYALHFVSMVFVAPVVEEIIFRGVGMQIAEKRGWSPVKGAVVTSIAFALWHGNWYLMIPAWIFGMIVYYLYARYRTLIIPILTHAIANGAMFFLMYRLG